MYSFTSCEGSYVKKNVPTIDTVCINGKCIDTASMKTHIITAFSVLGILGALVFAIISLI